MKNNKILALISIIAASILTVSCTTQSNGSGSQNTKFLDPNRSQEKSTPQPPTQPTNPNQPTQPNQPTTPGAIVVSCLNEEICVEFKGPMFANRKDEVVKSCTDDEHGQVVASCPVGSVGFCKITLGAPGGTPNNPQSSEYVTKFYGDQELAVLEQACKQAGGQFGH